MKIKTITYLSLIILFSFKIKAQENTQGLPTVEKMPEFIGGEDAMNQFISKNIKYPYLAKETGVSGTVYVSFVIDSVGNIKDVKAIKFPDYGSDLAREAERIVKIMPNWLPGKHEGKPVNVILNIPIKFNLIEDNSPKKKKK